jgi:hypothetical protein
MERLIASFPDVEMHHEYLCTHVQPLAVRYYLGLVSLEEAANALASLHGSAVRNCIQPLWGDSSNKLSWLIEPLDRLFPDARFIHLVRDGRKVASSFYYKLGAECYDDRSVAILREHLRNPNSVPPPPPEKKYWWTPPREGSPCAAKFDEFDQFQRICFHWGEVNRVILDGLAGIDPARVRTYWIEELSARRDLAADLLEFLELPYSESVFTMLQRPHNVGVPEDRLLQPSQRRQLMEIAGDMMERFGYDRTEEYRMFYDADRAKARTRAPNERTVRSVW